MSLVLALSTLAGACCTPVGQGSASGLAQGGSDLALTVYNQNFAVVRELFPIELKAGINELRRSGTTAQVESDSVVLRDPAGRHKLQVLEQSYRNDAVSESMLLSLYEGRTIGFQRILPSGLVDIVSGRIVRSGYLPGSIGQPIIEVDGTLRFQLPGTPLFPALADDTVLQPTLTWKIETDKAGAFPIELAYVTGGLSWHADYNIVAPERGELLDLIGWVTIQNHSGKRFDEARIKLMAGDVNKIQPPPGMAGDEYLGFRAGAVRALAAPVSEKSFDEYHLYSLAHRTTLRDRETKQVEFVRASGVKAEKLYVYDGAALGMYGGWDLEATRTQPDYGTRSNTKVWVMRELKNSEANQLGLPLPKGRMRFYQQDDDRQLEFIGENQIDHTPKDETLRIYVGNSFDVVGERTRTDFKVDTARDWADESFEIKLRNHKQEPVEVRVVEHLYRWTNWQVQKSSQEWVKKDAQAIEFRVKLAADAEGLLSYSVHYSW